MAKAPEQRPRYWFVLGQSDPEGKPQISDREFELWGNIPIPIFEKGAFSPASIRPVMKGTKYYENEPTVCLQFAHISQAVINAGRMSRERAERAFPENLVSIVFPQRLGRVLQADTEGPFSAEAWQVWSAENLPDD